MMNDGLWMMNYGLVVRYAVRGMGHADRHLLTHRTDSPD